MKQKGQKRFFHQPPLVEVCAKAALKHLGTQTILKISPLDYGAHIFVLFLQQLW